MIAHRQLSPEDLMAGAAVDFEIPVPAGVLMPRSQRDGFGNGHGSGPESTVQLRPLTIGSFQLIMKAGRQDSGLIPALMIKESLVRPALSLEQVKGLHMGLVNFLIAQIREISGLDEKKTAKN